MNKVHTLTVTADAALPDSLRATMSFDEYVAWLDEDTFAEWEVSSQYSEVRARYIVPVRLTPPGY